MPAMTPNSTDKTALIVVDVQPTFCEGGELPVEGGNRVAARIADLLRAEGRNYDLVATTQDWHIDPGGHFSDEPDFVGTWPPHGVAGSANAELHPALSAVLGTVDVSVKKGQHAAAYSGFEGSTDSGTSLWSELSGAGITRADVVGLAYDHCVKATALDAARYGLATRVLAPHTAAVSADTARSATVELVAAGVTVVGQPS